MKAIGRIGNYYGGIFIKNVGDKYYWIIENYDTDFDDLNKWEEISKDLYDKLIEHSNALHNNIPNQT